MNKTPKTSKNSRSIDIDSKLGGIKINTGNKWLDFLVFMIAVIMISSIVVGYLVLN